MSTTSLQACLTEIDLVNSADPVSIRFRDADHPCARIEGQRAHDWLLRLRPEATDAMQLAARAHHIRRWEVPRDSFPRTREGYHAWRTGLYRFHAGALGDIMKRNGYPDEAVDRAGQIVQKRGLTTDRDVQSHEDAVSLAFLEIRLDGFVSTVTDEQLVRALQRTWRKMSASGREAALALELSPAAAKAFQAALNP